MKKDDELSPELRRVAREGATEAPFTGALVDNHEQGMYRCAICGTELFSSDTKFDSGTGWPSFDQAIPGATKQIVDNSLGMSRTEVVCSNCGGHLGHVFNDGPAATTKQRFYINSCSLDFMPIESKKT